MNGVIVVNKPAGWTSHDAVAKMRRLAQTKKIGHLGTLDPNATGVLPLVVGRATRLSQFYTSSDKVYDAVIHFGWATDTYDAEGEAAGEKADVEVDCTRLEELLDQFRGPIQQVPPPVSAKKVKGTPAYKLARRKEPVELKPVDITIHELNLLGCDGAQARIRVHCSAGTYLRSIAHDLGRAYGGGAFLEALVRTRSAEFTLEQARTIEALQELAADGRIEDALIPTQDLLPTMPAQRVDNLTAGQIRQGRDFRASPFRAAKGSKYIKAISEDGDLLAIGEAKLPNLYHPFVVL